MTIIDKEDNSPLNITGTEGKAFRIKLKRYVEKNIIDKVDTMEKDNSIVINDWEELLDRLINTDVVDQEVIEDIALIVLKHEYINEQLKLINKLNKKF